MKLTLEVVEGTQHENDAPPNRRIHFYPSSVTLDDKPLLSVATRGPGTRLTVDQVEELRDYLSDWLAEAKD